MSWFKRRPRPKETQKHLPHKSMGPIARSLWNQAKKPKEAQENPSDKKS